MTSPQRARIPLHAPTKPGRYLTLRGYVAILENQTKAGKWCGHVPYFAADILWNADGSCPQDPLLDLQSEVGTNLRFGSAVNEWTR